MSLLAGAEAAYEWLRQHSDEVDGRPSFRLETHFSEDDEDGRVREYVELRIVGTFASRALHLRVDTACDGIVSETAAMRVTGLLMHAVSKIKSMGWVTP